MTLTEYNLLLVEAKNGSPSLKVGHDEGPMHTIHSLYDPEEEARSIVDAFKFDGRGMLVVLGLGLGYHLFELIEKFPDAEILVVEALPEIHKLAKERGKISGTDDKVRYIVGHTFEEAVSEITRIQFERGMPALSVFVLSPVLSAFSDYYQPVLNKLNATVSFRLWERLRYKKFSDSTLRIAIMDFDYFLTAEIERALKGLGHEIAKIPGRIKTDSASDMLGRATRVIVDFRPDFLLTVNHIGFDEEGVLSSFLDSIEMPLASWYVDSPNIIVKAFGRNVSKYTSVFVWDRRYLDEVRSLGFESVSYLPLAADENIFRPMTLKPDEMKKYGAEVGFAGNAMVKSTDEYMIKLSDNLHLLIGKLAKQLSMKRMTFEDALEGLNQEEQRVFNSLTLKERSDFETAVLRKATLNYRLSCIEELRGFETVIHGGRDWKELLPHGYTLRQRLNYYSELPVFYNACRVNFNATSLQMLTAVNQRVFDVPACGGFLLTDHQAAVEELFEVGKEMVTYRDKEEITGLVRFYLDNPEAREKIAGKGRGRILMEHTYKHRLKNIIRTMRERHG
ncbi:MAG: glycosyltransferase [Nitrospirae bacterium]|nr:glycosyltransferase [Nitrospirota bacterium]